MKFVVFFILSLIPFSFLSAQTFYPKSLKELSELIHTSQSGDEFILTTDIDGRLEQDFFSSKIIDKKIIIRGNKKTQPIKIKCHFKNSFELFLVKKGELVLEDLTLEECGNTISLEKSKLSMKNIFIKDVNSALFSTDSEISFSNNIKITVFGFAGSLLRTKLRVQGSLLFQLQKREGFFLPEGFDLQDSSLKIEGNKNIFLNFKKNAFYLFKLTNSSVYLCHLNVDITANESISFDFYKSNDAYTKERFFEFDLNSTVYFLEEKNNQLLIENFFQTAKTSPLDSCGS